MNASQRMRMGMIIGSIIGIVGAFCALMGILTAANIVPLIGPGFTGIFWLLLSAVVFLALMSAVVIAASKEMIDMLG